ncbi:DMT family transporter [Chloroflexi bacterium TSY]|nr:DMT family transporter [Chloroflexi bacterium TSY]
MTNLFVLLFITLICGIAITLQAQFMSIMTDRIGPRESVFITYGSGGLVIFLLMLIWGRGNLFSWRELPWYVFSSGLLVLLCSNIL